MPAALLIFAGNAKHAAMEQLIDKLIAEVTREVHVFARAHAPRVLPAETLVGMGLFSLKIFYC